MKRRKYLLSNRYRSTLRFSDVRKISLSSNDVLVFSCPPHLKNIFYDEKKWKTFIGNIEKQFPGVKCVLLDSDIDMTVLSSEELDKKHNNSMDIHVEMMDSLKNDADISLCESCGMPVKLI